MKTKNKTIIFCGIKTEIIKSRRRTISLSLNSNGTATLKAPLFVSDKVISDFLNSRKKWLLTKTEAILSNTEKYALKNNGLLLLYGNEISLKTSQSNVYFNCKDNSLYVPFLSLNAKDKVIDFYKNELKNYILPKAEFFAEKMNLNLKNITVTKAKTRWGSCSATNNISFSFRLLMCKKEVIDYVLIHELCHFLHKDHSRNFWQEVEKYNPNFKQNREWLKAHFYIMDIL